MPNKKPGAEAQFATAFKALKSSKPTGPEIPEKAGTPAPSTKGTTRAKSKAQEKMVTEAEEVPEPDTFARRVILPSNKFSLAMNAEVVRINKLAGQDVMTLNRVFKDFVADREDELLAMFLDRGK